MPARKQYMISRIPFLFNGTIHASSFLGLSHRPLHKLPRITKRSMAMPMLSRTKSTFEPPTSCHFIPTSVVGMQAIEASRSSSQSKIHEGECISGYRWDAVLRVHSLKLAARVGISFGLAGHESSLEAYPHCVSRIERIPSTNRYVWKSRMRRFLTKDRYTLDHAWISTIFALIDIVLPYLNHSLRTNQMSSAAHH